MYERLDGLEELCASTEIIKAQNLKGLFLENS